MYSKQNRRFKSRVLNMITKIKESKTLTKYISCECKCFWFFYFCDHVEHASNVNVNLMEQNVCQINGGIKINVNVSVKNITYVKKVMFGILVHVFAKMENI